MRKLLLGANLPLAEKPWLSLEDLRTLALVYYSNTANHDKISTIYEKYFAESILLPDRDVIMDLVIKGEAVFLPIYHLIKHHYYVTAGLVRAYDIPIPEINPTAPIISVENTQLSPCERVFLEYLFEHFSDALL